LGPHGKERFDVCLHCGNSDGGRTASRQICDPEVRTQIDYFFASSDQSLGIRGDGTARVREKSKSTSMAAEGGRIGVDEAESLIHAPQGWYDLRQWFAQGLGGMIHWQNTGTKKTDRKIRPALKGR